MTDKTPGACQCHEKHAPTYWKSVVREYKDALEEAVRERDEALADAESRPLAPDAIADEMVERASHCLAMQQMPTPYSLDPDVTADKFYDDARDVLHAALTEPPARPEGAEDIERLIRDAENEGQGADNEALANYLAARLTDPTRKEG